MKRSAFTLIELLVVIAIIGILTGFVFVSLSSATSSAKDAKAKADLATISKAIMSYNALNNVNYPSTETNCTLGGGTTPCTTLESNLQPFLKNFSSNPNGGYYTYNYSAGNFTLSGTLSNSNTYLYSSTSGSWTESASPYPTWSKRVAITVTNPASVANYQHYLSVTYDSDMNADFSDLRFADSSGAICSYWIESKTNSSSAVVWVKVPTTNQTTIYMYYGNATAVSESNGDNTFEFFDDFLGSTLNASKWTAIGSPTISASIMTIPSTGAAAKIVSTVTFGQNYAMRTRCKSAHFGSTSYMETVEFQDQGYLSSFLSYSSGTYSGKHASYTDTFELTSISGVTANTYFILDHIRNGATSVIFKVDNANIVTHSTKVTTTTYGIRFSAQENGASVSADWVLVRKYTATEPTAAFGVEQNNL